VLEGPPLGKGTFVVREGTDIRRGGVLLRQGSQVTPAMAGVLRAAGIDGLNVYRKPRVAVIATGDEICDGSVPDANGPLACALLESWGCEAERLGPARDEGRELSRAVAAALEGHDIVITIGGVSMGKRDLVSAVVEGGEIVFKGVKVSPGKPFIASCFGRKPIFSLPGKPSGSYAALELLVKRFVLGAGGYRVSVPVSRDVELQTPGFEYVVFVELCGGEARPLGYAGSSVELFDGPEYSVSLLSTSARTVLSDGYFIAREAVRAGQQVLVNLL